MNAETSTFSLISSTDIASLNIRYEEYQHKHTGAKHIHLASDNSENVFLVALRTIPVDSTGVAHILEHTSLCGSEKYPVRDPFFMMIRRSLNTFMNAFTSSDWTAYPFASQSKKDFDNLLAVYLDAVFFARLDPLDFAQEGHRMEFEEEGKQESPLVYKGVVFNEMKGAMSSISSQLWQAVGEALFPDTTYGVNSGGDPAAIPDLSYEQLQAFYKTHYHPDNAIFITFGDICAREHQLKFEALALSRFASKDVHIDVPLQARFKAPIQVSKNYPLIENDADAKDRQCHRVMAWVLDDIRDAHALMKAHLLSSILLEDSASPLQHALETTELGKAPSPLCGLDDSGLEMVFICGLEGCADDQLEDFEQLILGTLQKVAKAGIPYERLTALLDQLELQQREIKGDSYPYGLQLILSCLTSAIHRGNPAAALDIDPVLNELRTAIKAPDFTASLVKELLLDNTHRATVTLRPDAALPQQMIDDEKARLAQIRSTLTNDDKQAIIDTAQALKERQNTVDDPEVLPKVGLEDVPESQTPPDCKSKTLNERKITFYPQGTNGLTYRQIITPLPALDEAQQSLLSLHNRILTEVGIDNNDYLTVQAHQTRSCGSINAFSSMQGEIDNEQKVAGYFTLSAKGLVPHSQDIDSLLQDTYRHARFDEHQRIAELIAQSAAHARQAVTGNGHALAMGIASQGLSPTAKLSHGSTGMLGIQRLKALDKRLKDKKELRIFSDKLAELHTLLTSNPAQLLAIGEVIYEDETFANMAAQWPGSAGNTSTFSLAEQRAQTRELWLCNTQVNFCAKAYATVPAGHKDAAALTVLAGVLRNGFLHTAIREQGGAYGGGASQDSMTAAFRFFSYRDPRLTDTLDDFDRSIQWLLETQHEWRVVEEAILGVVGSIDKPSSPAGTAKQHFHDTLFGRTQAHKEAFRNSVLAVKESDLKRVAETYLRPEQASIGIVTHTGEEAQYTALCEKQGIQIEKL